MQFQNGLDFKKVYVYRNSNERGSQIILILVVNLSDLINVRSDLALYY